MTTTWASPSYAVFGESEIFWCVECESDEIFDRPEGAFSPEAFCVSCGFAVFLWVADLEDQPAASSSTPTRAVETPAA